MSDEKPAHLPRIVLGVTADQSLGLMKGFPEFLHSCGWDVHVVSSPGPRLQSLRNSGKVTVHPIRMAREPSPLKDIRALMQWVQLLRKISPDVVSVGTPKAGLLGALAAWVTRVPKRVYLLRGLRLETVSGIYRRVLLTLERITAQVSHEVLTVSPSLQLEALRYRIGRKQKTLTIGHGSSNGIDTDRFSKDQVAEDEVARIVSVLSLSPQVPVVGFVGRLTDDKGLAVLADARHKLELLGIDYQLLIVGNIDSQRDLPAVMRLNSAGRPVVTTGHVDDPRPYYRIMDVLCLPTRREGFPNVVLEASAMGIPTVTTDATGAIDSVVRGATGWICRVDDTLSLSNALAESIQNPQLRKDFGSAARCRAESLFKQENVWQRYEEHYRNSIIGKPHTEP